MAQMSLDAVSFQICIFFIFFFALFFFFSEWYVFACDTVLKIVLIWISVLFLLLRKLDPSW